SKANKVICVSDNNYLDGKKRINLSHATTITNGVNTSWFDPRADHPDIRTEFNIRDDEIVVGYMARITAQKDPFTFLKAIAEIEVRKKIRFLIIGDGDEKANML